MINNEQQYQYSVQSLAKQYSILERDAVDPNYSADLRQTVLESTAGMIRKIEREVAVYLAAKYNLWKQDEAEIEEAEIDEPLARELVPLQKAA